MNSEHLNTKNIILPQKLDYPQDGVIIADRKVRRLYAQFFEATPARPLLELTAGERQKNQNNCQRVYSFLMEHNIGRNDIVHVFGGGTVCDLAAFAVGTFKRGCRLWLYPSTLLGMVDAAIGGKTGLNHKGIKNLIGSFYPAEKIIIHPPFLRSLPPKELRQGYAEMLKYTMLNPALPLPELKQLKSSPPQLLRLFVDYKMRICAADPYDQSERLLLNFGHSFGHALEAISRFQISHGDAIVMGMTIACDYAFDAGLIDEEQWTGLRHWLDQYKLPKSVLRLVDEIPEDALMTYMAHDKKNNGKLRLVLPVGDSFKVVGATLDAKERSKA